MSKRRCPRGHAILVLALLVAAGCGESGPELAPVRGTITLDGKPLAGAKVEFEPQSDGVAYGKTTGTPSYGKTDAKGRYELKCTHDRAGAMLGKHVVRITTRDVTIDAKGNEVIVPERLPANYHFRSKLIREVKPQSNTFDFPLQLESSTSGGG